MDNEAASLYIVNVSSILDVVPVQNARSSGGESPRQTQVGVNLKAISWQGRFNRIRKYIAQGVASPSTLAVPESGKESRLAVTDRAAATGSDADQRMVNENATAGRVTDLFLPPHYGGDVP